jgi:gluconolactonase
VKDGGYLLFSEIPKNQILKWAPDETVTVFREPSGFTGTKKFTGKEPGTNGLIIDAQGRLIMCCHGDRMIRRLEKDRSTTVLASTYQGKQFNSPNDLTMHSNGDIYFTDPPYGLPGGFDDPGREIEWCGVYRRAKNGEITLVSKNIAAPNGIALSPDERTLYVAQSNSKAANWTAFDVDEQGVTSNERIFYDATDDAKELHGAPDGMVVDAQGHIWGSGPGGIMIISPEGKLLGRILTSQATSNATFGEDGSTLFITADMFLLRVKTKTKGQGF